jgi:hypothetical protein
MMMKTWVWLSLAGFGWCALLVGNAFDNGIDSVIITIATSFVPFVIGIHAGVSYVRECEAKKGEAGNV